MAPGVYQPQCGHWMGAVTVPAAGASPILRAVLGPSLPKGHYGVGACLQRRVMELGKGLEHKACEDQLRECLVPRKGSGETSLLYSYLKGGCGKVGISLFSETVSNRTGKMASSCTVGD